MTPTIREVAREAGVSIATVSHALSGKRPVSPRTRRRIVTAARRLGYRPNRIAAAMPTGRTHTLGMVVPDIANPFFGELVGAAERAAAEHGYSLIVCSSELDAALELRHVETLRDRRVDALLYLAATRQRNTALVAAARAGTPIVVLDEEMPGLPPSAAVLTVENELGGALAAEHLIELGHRSLGVVSGPMGLPTAQARVAGFRRAAGGYGLELLSRQLVEAEAYTVEAGGEAARRLLRARSDLTAVFCGNDLIALGVIEAARALGRAVPGELSVVGFDDSFVSALVSPALTTIRQPLRELGKEAATLAIALLEGHVTGPLRRTLPVELVVRDSTAAAPGRASRRPRTVTARRT
jgi:LacI family transcriptional regulator